MFFNFVYFLIILFILLTLVCNEVYLILRTETVFRIVLNVFNAIFV